MEISTLALRRLQVLLEEALVIADQQGLFRESVSIDAARVALNDRLGIRDDGVDKLMKLIANG